MVVVVFVQFGCCYVVDVCVLGGCVCEVFEVFVFFGVEVDVVECVEVRVLFE